MSWRVLGVATTSLWRICLPAMKNFELANAPTSPCYGILMMCMIAPCIIICLTPFVSTQVNKLQLAVPVQQGYMKLQPTMENITHP